MIEEKKQEYRRELKTRGLTKPKTRPASGKRALRGGVGVGDGTLPGIPLSSLDLPL